ncbi:MAG: hypothetical protein ACXAC7_23975 [Candidatus Hodarchaeales archaeon]|jgi:hypothetical protein
MNSEKLILHIIKNTGLSRGEINDMIEKKKNDLRGYSNSSILLILARELAVITEIPKYTSLDNWILENIKRN